MSKVINIDGSPHQDSSEDLADVIMEVMDLDALIIEPLVAAHRYSQEAEQ